jgi:hypothetical protein
MVCPALSPCGQTGLQKFPGFLDASVRPPGEILGNIRVLGILVEDDVGIFHDRLP